MRGRQKPHAWFWLFVLVASGTGLALIPAIAIAAAPAGTAKLASNGNGSYALTVTDTNDGDGSGGYSTVSFTVKGGGTVTVASPSDCQPAAAGASVLSGATAGAFTCPVSTVSASGPTSLIVNLNATQAVTEVDVVLTNDQGASSMPIVATLPAPTGHCDWTVRSLEPIESQRYSLPVGFAASIRNAGDATCPAARLTLSGPGNESRVVFDPSAPRVPALEQGGPPHVASFSVEHVTLTEAEASGVLVAGHLDYGIEMAMPPDHDFSVAPNDETDSTNLGLSPVKVPGGMSEHDGVIEFGTTCPAGPAECDFALDLFTSSAAGKAQDASANRLLLIGSASGKLQPGRKWTAPGSDDTSCLF